MKDRFSKSIEVTNDCGATIAVPYWAEDSVMLNMGGDLSLTIRMPAKAALEFAETMLAAANACKSSGESK